jgi:homoserine dehydrogenase
MRKINLIQLGIGNVGRELVTQIFDNRKAIEKKHNMSLRYCGLFNSKGGIFSQKGLSDNALSRFPKNSRSFDLLTCISKIQSPFILIDVTTSDNTLPYITSALEKNGYVVLANKRPMSLSYKQFKTLYGFGSSRLKFETTVGAGLPVIQTLQTLFETGDKVLEINGCFSGTMGFLCSELELGNSFSKSVLKAKKLGYTESDPREDLSGKDVARKALILTRLMGRKIEMEDIKMKPLYPSSFDDFSIEQFMRHTKNLDEGFEKKFKKAKKSGNTLKFIARIDEKSCTVGIREVPKESDMGSLTGPDNIIVFTTKRYKQRPMVIKGPGAGPEVTAAGVFGDILNCANII